MSIIVQEMGLANTHYGMESSGDADLDAFELTEAEHECNGIEQDIITAENAMLGMEGLYNVAESTKRAGGFNQAGGHGLMVAANCMLANMGYNGGGGMPSMESYNSNAMAETTHGMEGLVDWIKKIWAGIWGGIKRAWDAAAGWFKKMFGSVERLKKSAAKLGEKAIDVNGTPDESEFEMAKAYMFTESGTGTVCKSGDIDNLTKYVSKVMTYKTLTAPLNAFSGDMEAAVKSISEADDGDKEAITAVAMSKLMTARKVYITTISTAYGMRKGNYPKGVSGKNSASVSPMLLGNVQFYTTISDDGTGGKIKLAGADTGDTFKGNAGEGKITTMPKGDIMSMVSSISNLCDALLAINPYDAIKAELKTLQSTSDELTRAASGDEGNKADFTKVTRAISLAASNSRIPPRALVKHASMIGNVYYKFAKRSLGNIKEVSM